MRVYLGIPLWGLGTDLEQRFSAVICGVFDVNFRWNSERTETGKVVIYLLEGKEAFLNNVQDSSKEQ